ncbi:hypothetical protein AGMMS49587_05000 [Spirochaetia bacterium]|nr:hypothetical protein AGMMS49587_05000 [Spirochaetia bacterium]
MGIRGEVFSTTVQLQNRTYFFNVKENRLGDLYLNIVESKNRESGGFERQSVILFADDLQDFLKGFDESLKVLEKAVREKRRNDPNQGRSGSRGDGRKEGRPQGRGEGRDEGGRPRSRFKAKDGGTAPRSEGRSPVRRGRKSEAGDAPVKRGKRVVVKKREE